MEYGRLVLVSEGQITGVVMDGTFRSLIRDRPLQRIRVLIEKSWT